MRLLATPVLLTPCIRPLISIPSEHGRRLTLLRPVTPQQLKLPLVVPRAVSRLLCKDTSFLKLRTGPRRCRPLVIYGMGMPLRSRCAGPKHEITVLLL